MHHYMAGSATCFSLQADDVQHHAEGSGVLHWHMTASITCENSLAPVGPRRAVASPTYERVA